MRVLFLRPQGSQIPSITGIDIINIEIFRPECIKYEKPRYSEFEAIGFTSINAIKCFNDYEEIKNKLIFTVGSSTADYLKKYVKVNNIKYPVEYTTKDLANLILNSGVNSIIVFRSKNANNIMREILKNIKYLEIHNYELILDDSKLKEAKDLLQNCKIDIVVLTSSEIANAVKEFLRGDCYLIVSIGPITSKVLSKLGIKFEEAKVHNIGGILEVISKYMKR
ncbi:MAG: uroporphyrinogen-III synthase [Sulfolobaceae archaeon]